MNNVLTALKGRKGNLVDLGSGDGRIVRKISQQYTMSDLHINFSWFLIQVHAAAMAGFKSVGIELNPWLVLYSRFKSLRLGVSKSTNFYRRDIWKVSLGPYNNVVIFGVDSMVRIVQTRMVKHDG